MKIYSLLSVIIYALMMAFVTSCSDTPTTSTDPIDSTDLKHYSSATNPEFHSISKDDPIAPVPYYQKKQTKVSSLQNTQEKLSNKVNIESQLIPNTSLNAKNQERLQEINQNLIFYCMKHRKSKAFKNETQCLLYTKNILTTCEKKHKIINTVMVNCIKDRLKKRK